MEDEIVIGPVVVQNSVVAETNCVQSHSRSNVKLIGYMESRRMLEKTHIGNFQWYHATK